MIGEKCIGQVGEAGETLRKQLILVLPLISRNIAIPFCLFPPPVLISPKSLLVFFSAKSASPLAFLRYLEARFRRLGDIYDPTLCTPLPFFPRTCHDLRRH